MSYILQHTALGFCWWDLVAVVVLAAVIALYVVKIRKLKKQKEELEASLNGNQNVQPASSTPKE